MSDPGTRRRRWRPWLPPLIGSSGSSSWPPGQWRHARSRPPTRRPSTPTKRPSSRRASSWDDPHPERMLTARDDAASRPSATTSRATRAPRSPGPTSSARTIGDWSYYVHSHGDYYWHAGDQRRYSGFREDSGDCVQSVVFSKDIEAKRDGRQSNLVVISTCQHRQRQHDDAGRVRDREVEGRRARLERPGVLRRLPRRAPATTTSRSSRSALLGCPRERQGRRRGIRPRDARRLHPRLVRRRLVGQLRLVRSRRPGRDLPLVPVGGLRCHSSSIHRSSDSAGGPRPCSWCSSAPRWSW